jgi:hypothetical protein
MATGPGDQRAEWRKRYAKSFEFAPPLEERDGTQARAVAADKDKWQLRHSADGYSYWVPPEIAYLINEGEKWSDLERTLRPVLAEREIKRQIALFPVSKRTETRCLIIALYCEEVGITEDDIQPGPLARKISDWAVEKGLPDADLVSDPRNTAFRHHVGCLLKLRRGSADQD